MDYMSNKVGLEVRETAFSILSVAETETSLDTSWVHVIVLRKVSVGARPSTPDYCYRLSAFGG